MLYILAGLCSQTNSRMNNLFNNAAVLNLVPARGISAQLMVSYIRKH